MVVKMSEMKKVVYKGDELFIHEQQFDFLVAGRADRIATKRYFMAGQEKGPAIPMDRMAMGKAEQLVEGGEVSGVELAIIIPPLSTEHDRMNRWYGKDWIEDW